MLVPLILAAAVQQQAANLTTSPLGPWSLRPSRAVELQGDVLFNSDALLRFNPATLALDVVIRGTWFSPVVLGSRVVFGRDTPESGMELWVTDGTAAGTFALPEVVPGPAGLDPFGLTLVQVGSRVFFEANVPGLGRELWVTDGSAAGTRLVLDVAPGQGSSTPRAMSALGNTLLFVADHPAYGSELWRSDGTATGTQLLIDLRLGTVGADYGSVAVFGSIGIIGVVDGQGPALLCTDGTSAGTRIFTRPATAEFRPITSTSVETAFGTLFLLGAGEVWVSDGTAPGTRFLLRGSGGAVKVLAGGARGAIFAIERGGAGPTELYLLPSLQAPLEILASIANSPSITRVGVTADETLLFRVDGLPVSLWRTDATPGGTYEIRPANQRLQATGVGRSGSRVLLTAHTGNGDAELWASDGSSAGTTLLVGRAGLRDGSSVPLFVGRVGEQSLLTAGTTRQVYALHATGHAQLTSLGNGVWPGLLHDDRLYFTGSNSTLGAEPWISDGTLTGTHLLADLLPGPGDGGATAFTADGDRVLFVTRDSVGAMQLAASDGTTAGTRVLTTLGSIGTLTPRMVVLDGVAFAIVPVSAGRGALVRSDGTASGTMQLLNFPLLMERQELAIVGGRLLFTADSVTLGTELWASDGTPLGTVLLGDLRPGSASSGPRFLGELGGVLLFSADDGVRGRELWRTDGTVAGTTLMMELQPGSAGSTPSVLARTASRLYFAATTPLGTEPWVTDGSLSGTRLVVDLMPGVGSSDPVAMTLGMGDELVLLGRTAVGSALWRSDGTAAGTSRLADLPGLVDHFDSPPQRVGNRLYFAATDPQFGIEPWVYDLGLGLVETYGQRCSGAISPRASAPTPPRLGNAGFRIELTGAPATTPAALLIAQRRTNISLAGACRLLVDSPDLTVGLTTDGSGGASVPLPVPLAIELTGGSLYAQWIAAMPGGPVFGIATLSDGLEVLLGL